MFKTATKQQSKLRLALIGPAGSGKTYTALNIAQHLGKRVAVIDTEAGSASKYSDLFKFDVCELTTHHPDEYIKAIAGAEQAGYDVVVIDSLTHAWSGKQGALELVDNAAKRSQSGNSYTAWRDVTPLHNKLVESVLQSKLHVIVTMRAKTEYVLETNSKGKQVPKKIGLAPIQRDGVEYEFDVTADMTPDHDMIIGKTRCHLVDGQVYNKPGKDVADILLGWVSTGAPRVDVPTTVSPAAAVLEPVDQPMAAAAPATAHWFAEIQAFGAACGLPKKYVDAYIKKRGGPDTVNNEAYFTAATTTFAKITEKLAEKYGPGFTVDQLADEDVKAAFREVDQ